MLAKSELSREMRERHTVTYRSGLGKLRQCFRGLHFLPENERDRERGRKEKARRREFETLPVRANNDGNTIQTWENGHCLIFCDCKAGNSRCFVR